MMRILCISNQVTARYLKMESDKRHLRHTINPSGFSWTRTSTDAEADAEWNSIPRIGRTLEITGDDVYSKAVFDCYVDLKLTYI